MKTIAEIGRIHPTVRRVASRMITTAIAPHATSIAVGFAARYTNREKSASGQPNATNVSPTSSQSARLTRDCRPRRAGYWRNVSTSAVRRNVTR
jgi:hypothetical protein